MKNFILIAILILCLVIKKSYQFTDTFNEELFLKPLPSGHINSYFQFTTNWKLNSNDSLHHTHLVSRSLAEIFLQYDIRELHVTLTHGLWRYENWGYPPIEASAGAEVWAWFSSSTNNLTQQDVNIQWKNLCNTLSGLLCASFNFIDETNTLEPKFSFAPQFSDGGGGGGGGGSNKRDAQQKLIRYGTLPREIVCTENLTPWKKLLPCSNQEGLASLLNSGYIHSTNYHSIGLHMRKLCDTPECNKNHQLEIKQTINLVFDKQIISQNSRDWSMRKMFGQGLSASCFLADQSNIYLDITETDFQITPEPTKTIISQRGGSTTKLAVYDLKTLSRTGIFHIAAVYPKDREQQQQLVPIYATPPLFVHRYLLGVGQERGKIVTKITNTHWTSLNGLLHENIPWFLPVYLHSLIIRHKNGTEIKSKIIKYLPGRRRERPYHLEIGFEIPARSTIEVSIDFDYIFLKWLEYPPDANHGHYIGSAVLSAQLPVARNYTATPVDGSLFADSFNASRSSYLVQIRTEALLISLPTPDFSMPYNVICLACTVVALAFGPIHNISTKKIYVPDDVGSLSLFARIKGMLFRKKT